MVKKFVNVWLRDLSSGKQNWLANVKGNVSTISVLVNRAGSRVAYTTCPDRPRPPQSSPAADWCNIFTVAASVRTSLRELRTAAVLVGNGAVMASQQQVLEGPKWTGSRINRIETATGRKTVMVEKPGTFLFAPDLSP